LCVYNKKEKKKKIIKKKKKKKPVNNSLSLASGFKTGIFVHREDGKLALKRIK
jgi:hypothetical protein